MPNHEPFSRLAHPLATTTLGGHQPGIDLKLRVLLTRHGAAFTLRDPPLGLLQRRSATLRGAQRLGQLITPLIAIELGLAAVGLLGLAQDLGRDLAIIAF